MLKRPLLMQRHRGLTTLETGLDTGHFGTGLRRAEPDQMVTAGGVLRND
jgi:hypothetical protein